jgi:hypothetical protein
MSMTIDLLDRLTTDATLRARRIEERKASRQEAVPVYKAVQEATRLADRQLSILKEVAEKKRISPRSLVLRTIETFCTACGARYCAPSVVLAEYDDNCRSVNRTADDIRRLERAYNKGRESGECLPALKGEEGTAETPVNASSPHALPRYHEVVTVHAPACERCF